MLEGTAEVPHPIAAAHLPEAVSVFDAATALVTAVDMVDPQPTLVELLVRHGLLPRERLPQIEINSTVRGMHVRPHMGLAPVCVEMWATCSIHRSTSVFRGFPVMGLFCESVTRHF